MNRVGEHCGPSPPHRHTDLNLTLAFYARSVYTMKRLRENYFVIDWDPPGVDMEEFRVFDGQKV